MFPCTHRGGHWLSNGDKMTVLHSTLLNCLHVSQLGTSSDPRDVCPVLNAAPTPSGHYTQPVHVARDLILQTRNLPTPVSTGLKDHCLTFLALYLTGG